MATVSVIIPTYGRAAFLNEAVASVLSQSCPAHEIIVVDDASQEPVIAPAGVTVIRHGRNMGPGAARNTGLAHATGDFVLFLDDDDWLHPDRIRWAAEQIGDRRTHACRSAEIHPDGRCVVRAAIFEGDLRGRSLSFPPPQLGQIVVRREDAVQMDPTLRAAQDSEWWTRMDHAADFAWSSEVGYFVRQHAGDRHGRPSSLEARETIVRRQWAGADRAGRARIAGRLSAAYLANESPWRALFWRSRAWAAAPSVAATRQLLGVARRSVRGGR